MRNKNNGIIIMGSCFVIIIDLISKIISGHRSNLKTKNNKKAMHREIVGQVFEMPETYPIINMGRTSDEMEKDII